MPRKLASWLVMVVALCGLSVVVVAQQFGADTTVRVAAGETRQGDLYAAGELIEVAGRLEGDLIAAAQRIRTTGTVTGDLFVAGRTVDIRGPVGDSTRAAGDEVTVAASIDGDLVTAGGACQILEGARVTGGFTAACGAVQLDGTVDGDIRAAGGLVIISGTVGGAATIRADRIVLEPGARIVGDLDYEARTPLTPEEAARVEGEVRFDEVVDEESPGLTAGSFLFWGWQTGAALLAGLLGVALFRRLLPQLASAVAENTTTGALLGFAAFLMVPAGAAIVMITVIGIPVGLVALLLFAVALYLAKLPIAVWAGGQLLARAGRPDASPYLAMGLGVIVLYILFALPYVGWLVWLGATWLGLGAMVLSGRSRLQAPAA